MSRLEFGPEPKQMEVTDIATGHFVFPPVTGKQVSYDALNESIQGAGYEIESAVITVAGTLLNGRHLETPEGQDFHLETDDDAVRQKLAALQTGAEVRVTGSWRTQEEAEVVMVSEVAPAKAAEEGSEDPP